MKEIVLNNLEQKVFYDRTKNGLDVFMIPNNKVSNYYITFNVKFGSIHTEFKSKENKTYIKMPNGIAHFLEHQMFYQRDGTIAHTYFSNLGSYANAATTYKYTNYEVISSNNLNKNLNYLLDYVQEPYFIKKNVESEKGIIIEEIRMGEDSPGRQLFEKLNSNLFLNKNYKYSVAGTIADIKNITAEKINKCYEYFYHPENMFIIISGNFKPLEVMTIINENQSKKEFMEFKNPMLKNNKEPIKVKSDYEEINMNIKIPKLNIAYKMSRKNFGNINDIKLKKYLQFILDSKFDIASDLTEQLLENNIISSEFYSSVLLENDFVVLILSTETKYPEECIKIIKKEMSNISINQELIERKKKVSISNLVMAFDNIQFANEIIQNHLIQYGNIIDNEYDILNELNFIEAKKVLENISIKVNTAVVIKPFKNKK